MKKTIFITSCHALISRNILSAGILEMLIKDGYRVIIIAPKSKKDVFVKNFASENVVICGIDIKSKRREMLMRYLSLASLNTRTLNIKRATEMKGSGKIAKYFLSNSLAHKLVRTFEKVSHRQEIFNELFDEFKPEKVFSTDIQNEVDVAMLIEAQRKGIEAIGMVRSWDNLTSKGLIRIIPDKLLVWNDLIKKEAIDIHGIPENIIRTVGIPHYDAYTKYDFTKRDEFYKKIGADLNKKIVTVIPIGDRYLRDNTVDRDVVDFLDKNLSMNYEILVRMPPGDYVRKLENEPTNFKRKVLYDRAQSTTENVKHTELFGGDDEHFAKIMYFSEVVISGPSTAVIDSVYINRPVILFGFDGYEKREYLDSICRYYDYDNFKPVLDSGGAKLAKTKEEFGEYLDVYIKDTKIDHENRRKLASIEVQYMDGKCGERLSNEIK
jgi:hypothetical protein